MSNKIARRWTRRVAAQVLVLGLALAGLASFDRQAPSVPLSSDPAAVSTNQIGVTPPPLGWASWNSFASSIDYNTIKAQADALAGGRATATPTATSWWTRTCGPAA